MKRPLLTGLTVLLASCSGEAEPGTAGAPPPGQPAPPQALDTAVYNDSVRWAVAESTLFAQRVAGMQRYQDCIAGLANVRAEMRPRLEAACRRLPTAPR